MAQILPSGSQLAGKFSLQNNNNIRFNKILNLKTMQTNAENSANIIISISGVLYVERTA